MRKAIEVNLDISVVIPVYNAKNTIEVCFESVFADLINSALSFEIILVNDGSTDNSLDRLKRLKENYSQYIILLNQSNGGVSSARNAGIKIARGKYISFCDSDDIWIAGKTRISMNVFDMYPDIKCLGGKFLDIEKKKCYSGEIITPTKFTIKYITLRRQLFKSSFSPPTVILSCDIIKDGLFFNEEMRYSEDTEYFARIVNKYPSVIVDKYFAKSIIGKQHYGESGLSSNLWKMEKAELQHLYLAYRTLNVDFFTFLFAVVFSIIKYFRRVFLSNVRKFLKFCFEKHLI